MTIQEYPDLGEIERRSRRYWSADGLPELMMGALWMLWGGALLFGNTLQGEVLWGAYWLVTPLFLSVSGFAAVWATKRLKRILTFPRGGYVEWKELGWRPRLLGALVGTAAAAGLAVVIIRGRSQGMEHSAAPAVGVLIALAFVAAALKQKAPHLILLAGSALALGLAFGATRMGWIALSWMLVSLGAVSSLLGGIRLALFRKRNPLPEAEP